MRSKMKNHVPDLKSFSGNANYSELKGECMGVWGGVAEGHWRSWRGKGRRQR